MTYRHPITAETARLHARHRLVNAIEEISLLLEDEDEDEDQSQNALTIDRMNAIALYLEFALHEVRKEAEA